MLQKLILLIFLGVSVILCAKGVTKWFGQDDNRVCAVNNVTVDINYGEMLYIVGPSGSGKTTFLSIISGILRPNTGTVIIKDQSIWQMKDDELTTFRLNTIGFVFQDFHLFKKLTSRENAAIPLLLKKVPWDEALEKAGEALDIVGLKNRMDLPPYKLSIGEQQRVAIARAITTDPDLLIFDEPTASLDGETGKRIIAFIRNEILTKDRAIIVVTHDNRIDDYATRIIHMEDGRMTV